MKSIVETNFKNTNLKLVDAFCRTLGGQSPCSSQIRRTQDQIDGFGCLFFDSLHHSTSLHLADLPSTSDQHESHTSRRIDHRHPGSRAPVAMPPCPLLWRRPSRSLASPTPHPTTPPLPYAAAGSDQDHPEPRSRAPARARARRVPWPTMDGADVRLSPLPPLTKDHLRSTP